MKKIVTFILSITATTILSMEQRAQPANNTAILLRTNNGIFERVPHEVMKEILLTHFVKLKRRPLSHIAAFRALFKSNKYFSQFFYDESLNGSFIQTISQAADENCAIIYPYDPIVSAAFRINTSGARSWMRNVYFQQFRNYKIISNDFFTLHLSGTDKYFIRLQNFLVCVLPSPLPTTIRRRLSYYAQFYSCSFSGFFQRLKSPLFEQSFVSENIALIQALQRNEIQSVKQHIERGAVPI